MASRSDPIAESPALRYFAAHLGQGPQANASEIRQLMRLDGSEELTEAERHPWDPERDPNELVDEFDWHPTPDPAWPALDTCHTVATRPRWWTNLAGRRAGQAFLRRGAHRIPAYLHSPAGTRVRSLRVPARLLSHVLATPG